MNDTRPTYHRHRVTRGDTAHVYLFRAPHTEAQTRALLRHVVGLAFDPTSLLTLDDCTHILYSIRDHYCERLLAEGQLAACTREGAAPAEPHEETT